MKKRLMLLLSVSSLVWLAASGCSEKPIDTAKVRAAFQSVSDDTKQTLEIGLKAIEQSNYVAAVRPLKKIAIMVKLDKDQRLILDDTLTKVEAAAAKRK